MQIKRRDFIQTSALASASLLVPKFLKAMERNHLPNAGYKVLVVIQLTGGNDGLNTIIPYRNDIYYKNRPEIAIPQQNVLKLTDEAGVNPHLTVLKELYDQGYVTVINNVGYPNPNRSHFRSMDIWHTASKAEEHVKTGWLGRYLEEKCKDCELPTQIIETDDILSLALKGENIQGIALRDPRKLYSQKQEEFFHALERHHDHEHQMADYLYKILGDTLNSTKYILEKKRVNASTGEYPSTKFSSNLKNIASLIRSDINTSVYYVSLGSFDTHVRQQARQHQLFDELNAGLKAFTEDLKRSNRFNDTLIMTFSEFGRRVSQNASSGTDHGTANNMFFISGALKNKGIINPLPDLVNLKDGDLQFQVDFKQVYATVLEKWLGSSSTNILGSEYKTMDFV